MMAKNTFLGQSYQKSDLVYVPVSWAKSIAIRERAPTFMRKGWYSWVEIL